MPAKRKCYRPIIFPKNPHTSVPVEQIRKAVREVVEMEKNDPAAYAAMVKKYANTVVRIVPG